jgi:histone H3/H4
MEYTDEEILDVVQRWDNTGLLYGLPLYEKQELAPIYDNVARVNLSKIDSDNIPRKISDLMDSVMYPICRRLYRRVGSEFNVEKMVVELIKRVVESQDTLTKTTVDDKVVNPIVEFCVEFADTYEDEIISKKQFNDEEYIERVDKILDSLRIILLNKEMVSFVDRTNSDWKIMVSDSKKSPKQTRYWNQKIVQEVLSSILRDTNKGI